jgi:hypothetical protein
MRVGRQVTGLMIGVFLVMVFFPSLARAQDDHTHAAALDQAGTLVRVVRESTERFKEVAARRSRRYALQFGCVSGPDAGAMGLHYVNPNWHRNVSCEAFKLQP